MKFADYYLTREIENVLKEEIAHIAAMDGYLREGLFDRLKKFNAGRDPEDIEHGSQKLKSALSNTSNTTPSRPDPWHEINTNTIKKDIINQFKSAVNQIGIQMNKKYANDTWSQNVSNQLLQTIKPHIQQMISQINNKDQKSYVSGSATDTGHQGSFGSNVSQTDTSTAFPQGTHSGLAKGSVPKQFGAQQKFFGVPRRGSFQTTTQ